MREIISIHIGQAGVRMGEEIWRLYCAEHGIQFDGTISDKFGTDDTIVQSSANIFSEYQSKCYIPNCVMLDSEDSSIEHVRSGELRGLFNMKNLISTGTESLGSFSKAYYCPMRKSQVSQCIERIQLMTDGISELQGFMIFHSMGGGSGSGLTSLLLEELSIEFPKKIIANIAVHPSRHPSPCIIEPYNSVLCTREVIDYCDASYTMDNHALSEICRQVYRTDGSDMHRLNRLIAQSTSDVTCPLRYSNFQMEQLYSNLSPYPRLHFLLTSGRRAPNTAHHNIDLITKKILSGHLVQATCIPSRGIYTSYCLQYRGSSVNFNQINRAITQSKDIIPFTRYSPSNIQVLVNPKAPPSHGQNLTDINCDDSGLSTSSSPNPQLASKNAVSLSATSNCSSIRHVLSRNRRNVDLMLQKKAFVHWFTVDGMEESELADCRETVFRIEQEYRDLES